MAIDIIGLADHGNYPVRQGNGICRRGNRDLHNGKLVATHASDRIRFPHERPQRILRTVVAWARYAELFKYSSTRKVLYGLNPTSVTTESRI